MKSLSTIILEMLQSSLLWTWYVREGSIHFYHYNFLLMLTFRWMDCIIWLGLILLYCLYICIDFLCSVFGISIIFAIVAIQCPCLYDIFIHKNNTYSRHLIVLLCNYYAISENHFHLILLHINVTSIVMTFVLVAIGTIMISCIIHICGLFKIAR